MAYKELAEIYDDLMEDMDYEAWAAYLDHLLQKYQCPGSRLVDLGCGTGNITIPLGMRGYQITGIDLSDEMLKQAMRKSRDSGLAIQWKKQDIHTLSLEEAPDAVIATFDIFNHLLEQEALQQLLLQLADSLTEKGLLIFDVQTPYKLRQYLGNQCFAYHSDRMDYMWENHFDEETDICTMLLTFFVRQENGLYQRFEEIHAEKVYDLNLLRLWLDFAGFDVLAVYRQLSEAPVCEEDHRAVFVAQKRQWDLFEEDLQN